MIDRYLAAFDAIPHLVFAALVAVVVAAIVGLLDKRKRRERLLHSVWFFVCAMASVICGSWVMFAIHG